MADFSRLVFATVSLTTYSTATTTLTPGTFAIHPSTACFTYVYMMLLLIFRTEFLFGLILVLISDGPW